jgi:predicted nucleotide-binding protein
VPKRSSPAITPTEPALLTEAVATARAKLEARVKVGDELLQRNVTSQADVQKLGADQRAASDYDRDLLRRLFTTEELKDEYKMAEYSPTISFGPLSPSEEVERYKERVSDRVAKLRSIIERLDLYQNPVISHAPTATSAASPDFTHAFLVHGRDEGARESVARFLTKLGIEPVILFEKASSGRTVIEKLEHYAKVPFAVVLLTPDDEGRLVGITDSLKPRARQNVLLELGFFVGKLGRENVCALCKSPIDVPSDWDGVVWVTMDEHDGWKTKLARELKAAGFTIDLTALL